MRKAETNEIKQTKNKHKANMNEHEEN